MDNFEFFKELYHKENDRRTEVVNALNIPIALITTLLTVLYYLVVSFESNVSKDTNVIFYGLDVIAFALIVVAACYIVLAFSDFTKGYAYTGIPYPNELLEWYKTLDDHYSKYNEKETAGGHFKNYLTENFAKHASDNMYVNDTKYEYIYKAKKFLVLSLVAVFLAVIPYSCSHVIHKQTVLSTKNKDSVVKSQETMKFEVKQIQPNQFNNPKGNNNVRTQEPKSDTATATTTQRPLYKGR